jgi:hypothetical protein
VWRRDTAAAAEELEETSVVTKYLGRLLTFKVLKIDSRNPNTYEFTPKGSDKPVTV